MAYSNIKDPSAYFQTAVYTGNGGTLSITNDGLSDLQPDFVWVKNRGTSNGLGYQHQVYDSNRGTTKKLMTSVNNAESTDANSLTAFNSDGFSAGSNVGINENAISHVAWQWKANGGTTASNTVGDISSTVQANTDAGFSIVTYTGNGSANQTIGHGLGAVPKMILFKNRSNSAYWYVYNVTTGNDSMMYLNLENAAQSLSSQFSTATTTTFNVSNENSTFTGYNTNSDNYVAYVFAEKQGFSKIGSYKGNTNVNGPFIYTGFKPAWVMIKKSSGTGGWVILDNKRDTFNVVNKKVAADKANGESTVSILDFLSNGFKLRVSNSPQNQTGSTYIYMAFAENPFVAGGIPTTAR